MKTKEKLIKIKPITEAEFVNAIENCLQSLKGLPYNSANMVLNHVKINLGLSCRL